MAWRRRIRLRWRWRPGCWWRWRSARHACLQGGRRDSIRWRPCGKSDEAENSGLLAGWQAKAYPTYSSSPGGFLCFGFFRDVFGSIAFPAGTGPTRSRAMARTSLAALKVFFLRGKHPPYRGRQHFRRERLVQKRYTARSGRFERGNIHRVSAGRQHAQRGVRV